MRMQALCVSEGSAFKAESQQLQRPEAGAACTWKSMKASVASVK